MASSLTEGSKPLMREDQLFTTPPDLVCPITQDLFVDPVINALGQVYERSAIERHMATGAAGAAARSTDPITNTPLPSRNLTPVYAMRSRAAEYRAAAVRTAAAHAAAPDCADPMPYLRRAADLLAPCYASRGGGGAGAGASAVTPPPPQAPGISPGFVAFLCSGARHHGRNGDGAALKFFADELRRGGHTEAAAAVLFRLLLSSDQQQQQAEFLRLCLECWASPGTGGGGRDGRDGGGGGGAADAGAVDAAVVARLADFVQCQHRTHGGLRARQALDVLEGAALGQGLLLALAEELLARRAGEEGSLAVALAVRHAQLCVRGVEARVAALEAELVRVKGVEGPRGVGLAATAAPGPRRGGRRWRRVASAAASAACVVLAAVRGDSAALRLARVVPVVLLLQPDSSVK